MKTILKITMLLFLSTFLVAGGAIAAPLGNGPATIDLSGTFDLQEVVNTVFGTDAFDVQTSQTGVGGWEQAENDVAAFRVISQFPNATDAIVGVYDLAGGNEALILDFEVASSSSFFIQNGDLYVNNAFDSSGWSDGFGFYSQYTPSTGPLPIRYTEDSKNGGATFAATYLLADGTTWDTSAYVSSGLTSGTMDGDNDWLIAMESDGSFLDYQDVVFMVEDVSAVPEPATMLLSGLGLLGIGAYLRRRFKKA